MKNKIAKDTALLASIQIALQILGLMLNIFITRMLGSSSIGVASLIYTFYCFAVVLSTGNIFVSASRFISEEIGKKSGAPNKIFRYSIIFCTLLSIVISVAVFIIAPEISTKILKNSDSTIPIRIIAFSLPLCAIGAAIKGYFNAYRNVIIPAIADIVEFLVRGGSTAFLIAFFVRHEKLSLLFAIAMSIILSEIVNFIFIFIAYLKFKKPNTTKKASINIFQFVRFSIPIMLNSYLISILSSTNDALIPITLKQFGSSMETALSQYGLFEAIVLPVLFFPAVVLSCLSCILVPEISRERFSGNTKRLSSLVENTIHKTFSFSVFITAIMLIYGNKIGFIVSGDAFTGKVITILAPIIPFIYLEIILEGILRGFGKHSFSSLNYLAEYVIRISVLLICVPFFGFYGILASYFASNIICNISRIVIISKTIDFNFNIVYLVFIPLFSAVISVQLSSLITKAVKLENLSDIPQLIIYSAIAGIFYLFIQKVILSMKQNNSPIANCN